MERNSGKKSFCFKSRKYGKYYFPGEIVWKTHNYFLNENAEFKEWDNVLSELIWRNFPQPFFKWFQSIKCLHLQKLFDNMKHRLSYLWNLSYFPDFNYFPQNRGQKISISFQKKRIIKFFPKKKDWGCFRNRFVKNSNFGVRWRFSSEGNAKPGSWHPGIESQNISRYWNYLNKKFYLKTIEKKNDHSLF